MRAAGNPGEQREAAEGEVAAKKVRPATESRRGCEGKELRKIAGKECMLLLTDRLYS